MGGLEGCRGVRTGRGVVIRGVGCVQVGFRFRW